MAKVIPLTKKWGLPEKKNHLQWWRSKKQQFAWVLEPSWWWNLWRRLKKAWSFMGPEKLKSFVQMRVWSKMMNSQSELTVERPKSFIGPSVAEIRALNWLLKDPSLLWALQWPRYAARILTSLWTTHANAAPASVSESIQHDLYVLKVTSLYQLRAASLQQLRVASQR